MKEVKGPSLRQVLSEDPNPWPAVRQSARALAAFNQEGLSAAVRHSQTDEQRDIERAVRLLGWACPELKMSLQTLVERLATALGPFPHLPTHRDLKPEHFLVSGDRIALLDLDWFATSDPLIDLGLVLAQLRLMSDCSSVPMDRCFTAAQVFADEYLHHVPKTWPNRLPVYFAAALLKVAVGPFRRQEPNWSATIATLVDEAQDALGGKLW